MQIDFDDVAAINPELLQPLPLHPKDNLPLQVNVLVGACHLAAASAPEDSLGFWLFAGLFSETALDFSLALGPLRIDKSRIW